MIKYLRPVSNHLINVGRKVPVNKINYHFYLPVELTVLSLMIYTILLILHITGGSFALIGELGAVTTKVCNVRHKWHLLSGRHFFPGMTVVFLTTLPMTLIKPNLFLLIDWHL